MMSNKSDPRIMIELLATRFPRTFFVDGSRRQPLKIGIFADLAAAELTVSSTQLRTALRVYTNSPGYLSAMCEGEARIGLDGQPAGRVSEEESKHARRKLAVLEARWGAPEALPEDAVSEPASPTVGRLGLQDLKRAWQQRQAARKAAE